MIFFKNFNKPPKDAYLFQILFGVIIGAINMGLSTPHIEAFAMARGAAASIFAIIERKSAIDSLSEKGIKPKNVDGNIIFKDVHFEYPNRPEVKVNIYNKLFE